MRKKWVLRSNIGRKNTFLVKCVLNVPKCIQVGARPFFDKFSQKYGYLKGCQRWIFEKYQISLMVNLLWVFQCENHNWFGCPWFGLAIGPETNFTSEILSISTSGWLKSKIPQIFMFPTSKGTFLWIQKSFMAKKLNVCK